MLRKTLVGPRTIAASDGSNETAVGFGGRMRRLRFRIILTVLTSVAGIFGFAVPANAATWHTYNGMCGTFWEHYCSVQYTGSWPGGQVRGEGDRQEYEVALESSCGGGSYVIVAKSFPLNGGSVYTPVVSAGKTCQYETFMKTTSGGKWWFSNNGAIYLGD